MSKCCSNCFRVYPDDRIEQPICCWFKGDFPLLDMGKEGAKDGHKTDEIRQRKD